MTFQNNDFHTDIQHMTPFQQNLINKEPNNPAIIHPVLPFKVHQFTLQFKQQSCTFVRPQNPDDVLDSIPEELYEKDRFLPYWAEQWPSSEVLHTFLQSQNISHESKVIELGCGLGIISTLVGFSAQMVIATDISFDALLFTKKNIELNNGHPKPCSIDWRALPFKSTFDLLIASDILYEARWTEPILNCCKQLLSTNGKAWIADPCRSFWGDFKKRSEEYGFKSTIVCREPAGSGKNTIEILELKL